MGAYANVTNAASISGVAETDISTYQRRFVDMYIESMLNRTFGEATSRTDYFDGQSNCKHIQLTHYPVISVTLFRDNQRDSNYTDLVEDTDFAVDKEAGIIELIRDDWNILKGSTSLTVGTKTVKITYTWGYESIPDSISIFADSMLAWIVETKESIDNMKTSNGAILSKVNIGDYAEAYSTNNKQIDGKYKDILGSLTEHLIQRYKFWGESGNYHVSL